VLERAVNAPIVLSIGTTHPWNVAGVGRDLVVGCRLGARVFTAVAAVSAQHSHGVAALQAVEPELLRAQLAALPWQAAGAVRVGALPSAPAVRLVAAALRANHGLAAVVDPVFGASRGGELNDAAARYALRDELAVLPNVVLTPNLDEAAWLLGRAALDGTTVVQAARDLAARGARAVLLKGGHLEGDPTDVLAFEGRTECFTEPRIAATMHGTGCTLAMALACELAGGAPLVHAVRAARAYVRAQIAEH
jgi:hydroxymethylpyrimidine/phosphomethylpyrimidine kinase